MKPLVHVRSTVFATALLVVLSGAAAAEASGKPNPNAPMGSPDYYPSAERPVGWRGDGTGAYPAAMPPLEWYRRPKSAFFNSLRVLGPKPKGAASEGQPLNMGTVRQWMLAGPFDAKDHATALEDVTQPDEAILQPAVGESLAGKPWKVFDVSVANQSMSAGWLAVDLVQAYGLLERQERQNHPGTMPAQVSYACTNIWAAEAGKVILNVRGTRISTWLNGAPVKSSLSVYANDFNGEPTVDLVQGWNRLVVKVASNKGYWSMSAQFKPLPGTGYETRNIVWMAPMPGASWGSPIIVGQKVFVSADEGTLLCLNKSDGQVLWTRSITYYHAVSKEEQAKFPELAAKAQQLDQMMQALPADLNTGLSQDGSKADGNVALKGKIRQKIELERSFNTTMGKADKAYDAWGNDRGTTTPTPVSDGKNVYVAYYGGNKSIGANVVACFDLDGRLVWIHFTGSTGIEEHGTHSTPVLTGNQLVYLSGSTLFGYDKATGKVLWKKEKLNTGTGTGASLLALRSGGVDAAIVPQVGIFRSSDGEQLWASDVRNAILTPSLIEGVLYGISGGGNETYYALKVGERLPPASIVKVPWKGLGLSMPGSFSDLIVGAPLCHDGLMYVVSEGAGLTVLDALTAKPVYTKPLEALNPRLMWVTVVGVCSGPNLAGKYIHIRDDQAQTLVIAPGREYKELAKNVLWESSGDRGNQQESQSNPYYEGGRIYYRTQGFLYCIGEK